MTLEALLPPSPDTLSGSYEAVEYDKNPATWKKISPDIFALFRKAFPVKKDFEQALERGFNGKTNTAVVLYDTSPGEQKKLIGYTFAIPMPYRDPLHRRSIPTAAVDTTVLEEGYRGQGLVGIVMRKMEELLHTKGYQQVERSVVTENGYADTVERYYGAQGRILQRPLSLRPDRRRFIIKL